MKYDTEKFEVHTKEVDELHKKRVAFVIVNGKPIFVENSTKSHLELCKELGVDESNFDNITRGFFLNDYIVFYCGNFETNDDVVFDAKKYCIEICNYLKLSDVNIYCGLKIGKLGDIWPPLKVIGCVKNGKFFEN